MDERVKLQLQQIGTRYLRRTLEELEELPLLIAELRRHGGEAQAAVPMKRIEGLGHRIYGSGAMFGFEELSARAHDLERLAAAGKLDEQCLRQLSACADSLQDAARTAGRSRGIV
jgi:HPt (histidine-containing phosphotransfer) domain-containing protein